MGIGGVGELVVGYIKGENIILRNYLGKENIEKIV